MPESITTTPTTIYPVDPAELYSPAQLDQKGIAKTQTLAQWRHQKRGPPYHKMGVRVVYLGKDILDWLNAHRVVPEAA